MFLSGSFLRDRGDEFRSRHYARLLLPLIGILIFFAHAYTSLRMTEILNTGDISYINPKSYLFTCVFILLGALVFSAYAAFTLPHVNKLSTPEQRLISGIAFIQKGELGQFGFMFGVTLLVSIVIALPILGQSMMALSADYYTLTPDLQKTELHYVLILWLYCLISVVISLVAMLLFLRIPTVFDKKSKGVVQTIFLHAVAIITFWMILEPRWVGLLLEQSVQKFSFLIKASLLLSVVFLVSYLQRAIGRRNDLVLRGSWYSVMTGVTDNGRVSLIVLFMWIGVGAGSMTLTEAFETQSGQIIKERIKTNQEVTINGAVKRFKPGFARATGNEFEEIFIETYAGFRHPMYSRVSRLIVIGTKGDGNKYIEILSAVIGAQVTHWQKKVVNIRTLSGPIFYHAMNDYLKTKVVDDGTPMIALNRMVEALDSKDYQRYAVIYHEVILSSKSNADYPSWLVNDLHLLTSLILVNGLADIDIDYATNQVRKQQLYNIIRPLVKVYDWPDNEKLSDFQDRTNEIFEEK